MTFFRVYSGVLAAGAAVYNSTKTRRERIGRLLKMHANKREEIKEVYAGDIAAAVGLRDDDHRRYALRREQADHPRVDRVPRAGHLRSRSSRRPRPIRRSSASPSQKLATEDPSFRVHSDKETGQTIISGMGELHLEIIVDRLLREFKVDANVGKPQVAYRETIRNKVEQEGKFVRQTGGRGQYGHVVDHARAAGEGRRLRVRGRHQGRRDPAEFMPAVEKGVREAFEGGVLAGYPMVDVKVTLIDGSYHDVDSSEIAFKIAGSMAAKEGAAKAKPIILEPIMAVEVVEPEEFMGDVIGDLSSRRGQGSGAWSHAAGAQVINAQVPLAEMFGYATDLRSKTQGRATYTMQFAHYEAVPQTISEEIAAEGRRA